MYIQKIQVSVIIDGVCDNQITLDEHELSCNDSNDSNSSGFWNSDDDILLAAVDTLGFTDWERVSSIWFLHEKAPEECAARAYELAMKPRKRKNREGFGKPIKFEAPIILPKRRRELESLEERRLFGKMRDRCEQDLIHRAYIVGETRLQRILKLNGTKEAVETGEDITISYSSLMMEMKRISTKEINDSIRAGARSITLKKLPKAVAEMEDSQVLTPPRRAVDGIALHHAVGCAIVGETNDDAHLLDLGVSELLIPLKDALDNNIMLLSPTKNDGGLADDTCSCLADFASPKMKIPNPWLPFPSQAVQGVAVPKQFFFIR